MIPLSKPALGPKTLKYATQAIKAGQIAQGPFIARLEAKFAATQGFKHASACSNGTMALFLALRALGIENGEVIIPSLTFAGTADAVLMAGAKPVFADIDENTFSLDPPSVEQAVTSRTKAIIAVGLYGRPAKVKPLRRFNVPIIEDAAESLGAQHGDADITCFSFFGNKVMTTGEGGMCATDSHEYKQKIDLLRNHGRQKGYWHIYRGTNARMSNLAAAVGLAQLEDLPKNLRKRRKVLAWYGMKDVYKIGPWVMIFRSINKENAVDLFQEQGIDARVGFYPLHLMPAYEQKINLPVSEKLGKEIVLLPCYPGLTKGQVKRICQLIN